ncbi:YaiI/YqxD family protein [Leeia sp. TBRC 13508]|uniref:UPF0178 protein LIN78_02690 n=1 Tax=Leeia speluncae TaxID=2884804 RepID=A0ABS8D377_9NEIS|nr:YaiI/YqxD family protein [Leeia speluncae]MCB6182458.1 YaiI/YqxD family protein [Leeia speluncae]
MRIYVDADACPVAIKEVIYRAANRCQLSTLFVANRLLNTPPSDWIKAYQVPSGFDEADKYIHEIVEANDLVITSDIPLASLVIAKGATVIDFKGELIDKFNISERLSIRDFMESLRNSGVETGGPSAFSAADKQQFSNQLDRLLTKFIKS